MSHWTLHRLQPGTSRSIQLDHRLFRTAHRAGALPDLGMSRTEPIAIALQGEHLDQLAAGSRKGGGQSGYSTAPPSSDLSPKSRIPFRIQGLPADMPSEL